MIPRSRAQIVVESGHSGDALFRILDRILDVLGTLVLPRCVFLAPQRTVGLA